MCAFMCLYREGLYVHFRVKEKEISKSSVFGDKQFIGRDVSYVRIE